jgi:hypothetical protein
MAKCELPKGILSISGKLGGMIFKTYTRPDGTTETRAYRNPYRAPGYQRSTPVTENEVRSRSRFSLMSREVTRRINAGDRRPRKAIWEEVKADFANNAGN